MVLEIEVVAELDRIRDELLVRATKLPEEDKEVFINGVLDICSLIRRNKRFTRDKT